MTQFTIKQLIEGYEKKEFSPVEVTKQYLEDIKKKNQELNAYLTVTEDLAYLQAEIAEKQLMTGDTPSPLLGVPLSYKDLLDTKGIRTTNGGLIHSDHYPTENATIVNVLTKAGGINLGKTNLHEYAFGISSDNPFYGPVRNPWNTSLIAGGSSGGSGAALAANLCLGSIGTDTGGSIRVPASCCGIVGLKPTYALLDTKGVFPLSWTLDHAGPMTQNVSDLAIMMEVLTNRTTYTEQLKPDVKGLRIGVPTNYFNEKIDPEVLSHYQKALKEMERLGAHLIEVDTSFAYDALEACFTIATAEVGYVHRDQLPHNLNQYGEDVRNTLLSSQDISSLQYITALKKQNELTARARKLFNTVDIIATPTLPVTATEIGKTTVMHLGNEEDVFQTMIRLTCVFDLTGQPALSIPCGLSSSGLPVGLQLVANHHREDLLIRAGYTYEQAHLTEFYEKRARL